MTNDWERLQQLKQEYLDTKAPQEQDFAVRSCFHKKRRRHWGRQAAALAACFCLLFMAALNTNAAFAAAASQLPVLGQVAQVLTFRQYSVETEQELLDVRVPRVAGTGSPELEERINREIQEKIDAGMAEAQQRADEEYQAYLATGGDPDSFIPVTICFDYEVKSSTEEYLSFELQRYEVRASSFTELTYYTINLKTGGEITLEDLLGPQYREKANAAVQAVISASPEDFFTPEQGGFTGITDTQRFYINEAGNPVLVFEKYEIAPGALGVQEIEVPAG